MYVSQKSTARTFSSNAVSLSEVQRSGTVGQYVGLCTRTERSKEAVKSAFVGISVNINATDMSEITRDIIVEQCNKV